MPLSCNDATSTILRLILHFTSHWSWLCWFYVFWFDLIDLLQFCALGMWKWCFSEAGPGKYMGRSKRSKLLIILAAGSLNLFPSLNFGKKGFFSFFSIEKIFKGTVCSVLNFAGLDVSSAEKLAWFSGRLCGQSETTPGIMTHCSRPEETECLRISPRRIWRF